MLKRDLTTVATSQAGILRSVEKGVPREIAGRKGETYNEIISKLIDIAEQVELFNKQKRILAEEEFVSLEPV